jgi:hypothetical protein
MVVLFRLDALKCEASRLVGVVGLDGACGGLEATWTVDTASHVLHQREEASREPRNCRGLGGG